MGQETARVHQDGFGCTFLGSAGYTAYRFIRIHQNRFDTNLETYLIKERHQRHGTTRRFYMRPAKWEALMAEAQASERGTVHA